jgi:hypothetical protein
MIVLGSLGAQELLDRPDIIPVIDQVHYEGEETTGN